MRSKSYRQGLYTPKHPEKYVGDLSKITYRSSWELECFRFLDNNINVYAWCSEPFAIPYIKPTDGKIHKYYVDFYVHYKNSKQEIIKELLEVKPAAQCAPPVRGKKKNKTYLYESVTYAINVAKWKAALNFAEQRGLRFRVITERSLFKN